MAKRGIDSGEAAMEGEDRGKDRGGWVGRKRGGSQENIEVEDNFTSTTLQHWIFLSAFSFFLSFLFPSFFPFLSFFLSYLSFFLTFLFFLLCFFLRCFHSSSTDNILLLVGGKKKTKQLLQ